MKKYLSIQLIVLMMLLTSLLTACQQGSNTPVDEYVSKLKMAADNVLKGTPGSGTEFSALHGIIRFRLKHQIGQFSMYSQTQQYYVNEINKIEMYDEALYQKRFYSTVTELSAEEENSMDTIFYRGLLTKNPKSLFHPTQLRAGKIHSLAENAWAYETISGDAKLVLVFVKNAELGLVAVVMAPTLDLAKEDYKKWQAWWESTGKQEHFQRIEKEKKDKEEREKRAEYEKQKPERDAAVASVQQDMLSLLTFSDVKYEVIEDRGGFALLLKFKVKQSTERPVTSMECDIVIKNKDNKIADAIRVEDRHKINFEPNKLYIHEIGVKPQSTYRQNLVRKIATSGYSAEIRPVQFYNEGRVPLPGYEIEKDLVRNADGSYSYKGKPVAPLAHDATMTQEALQATIQAETLVQEAEAKIFKAKHAELAQKYIGQISVSFVSLTKKRADPTAILVFTVQNNTGLALEEVTASFEVLEGGAIVKSGAFSVDIAEKDSSSPKLEKAVHFFDGEPFLLGFQDGTYTMRFEVKKATLNGVKYEK